MPEYLKIGDFARLVGVSKSTLRLWENKGILIPHHKTPTGYRYYTKEQADKLLSKENKT